MCFIFAKQIIIRTNQLKTVRQPIEPTYLASNISTQNEGGMKANMPSSKLPLADTLPAMTNGGVYFFMREARYA